MLMFFYCCCCCLYLLLICIYVIFIFGTLRKFYNNLYLQWNDLNIFCCVLMVTSSFWVWHLTTVAGVSHLWETCGKISWCHWHDLSQKNWHIPEHNKSDHCNILSQVNVSEIQPFHIFSVNVNDSCCKDVNKCGENPNRKLHAALCIMGHCKQENYYFMTLLYI